MKDDDSATDKMERIKLEDAGTNHSDTMDTSLATSTIKEQPNGSGTSSPAARANSSPRSGSSRDVKRSKSSARTPQQGSTGSRLFHDLPDMTSDACTKFQVIPDCLYGSKSMGSTDNEAYDCDCREERRDGENTACGEDSDCINRATKVECSATAENCGGGCLNQRFQRKQFARVSVIKTEKKGYGLRADADLNANDFIFEYIGEVINEPAFRRRMLQYDDQGIKHFYFMSLSKNEFVDATRKGNLGRFCNHSCNPNCYVDKWIVGDKLRMGIFALRHVAAGEELVFNYNVDRYGADPQPCYCGEQNCVGFIGGKTQTERATKLPPATVEALGVDLGDGWDTSVAKKTRKKKTDEDDEEYVNSLEARALDEEDASKVMAALMQCKEKWIAVKLLDRIQRCHDEQVIHSVMRMHAYQILKTVLNTFIQDFNVVLQILHVLDSFPRLTRNKIQDSNIEISIQSLASSEHDEVASRATKLLDDWSKLKVAYRIQRRKVDPNMPVQSIYEDRRGGQSREDELLQQPLQSKPSPKPVDAPKGPRSNIPQRNNSFYGTTAGPRQRRQNTNGALPQGWFVARDASGSSYYYNRQGTTTWQRPTQPADAQKAPSKAVQEQLAIQNIIDRVTKEGTPKQSPPQPSQTAETSSSSKDSKKEKWRSLPMDKQMKIYENTVFPPVKYMLDKFRHKLPKDELKRLGKEIARKLVASDYKNNRVEDPTAPLSEKQNKKIKGFVKGFLDRAVEKFGGQNKEVLGQTGDGTDKLAEGVNDDISVSDIEDDAAESRKRKRDLDATDTATATPSEDQEIKRLRKDEDTEAAEPSPPPPPPPPPADALTAEHDEMRVQEEALMRENEEAQRMDDAARSQENDQNRKQEVLSH